MQRFLVVGLGSIGKRHVQNLRTLFPSAEITVLRHQWTAGMVVPSELGCDACVGNMEDALAKKPQAAIIANPASHHLLSAMPLAAAGVHLLVEKPLSIAPDGVDELLAVCKENHIILMVGYNLRFLKSLQQFRAFINEGLVGRVLSVRAEVGQYLPTWRPDADYRQGVSAQRRLGGGVLLELSHDIDYLLWLFGTVSSVTALLGQQGDLDIDVEDTAHLLLRFTSSRQQEEMVATLSMDFIRRDPRRQCKVIGSHGTLVWDGIAGTVTIYEPQQERWRELFSEQPDRNYTYLQELKHFIESVDTAQEAPISGWDGKAVLEVVTAARRSSELGESITVGS
ncbi:MAG: Gfo/Idh/MocA family oxidoreductase [Desulfobulbaceae bacterium]|nr:Gfo/Idh/MocA family oxidoreductase [Desulfobulbaceae bacterium]